MICFEKDNIRFNFRSVAVILEREHVLLHTNSDEKFWALPGGRCEFMEFSHDTIPREIKEEIDLECKVIRPLWYVENFFEYEGQKSHEVGNYYLTKLAHSDKLDLSKTIHGLEKPLSLKFKWHHVSKLQQVNLYPTFLKQALLNIPKYPEYIHIKPFQTNNPQSRNSQSDQN